MPKKIIHINITDIVDNFKNNITLSVIGNNAKSKAIEQNAMSTFIYNHIIFYVDDTSDIDKLIDRYLDIAIRDRDIFNRRNIDIEIVMYPHSTQFNEKQIDQQIESPVDISINDSIKQIISAF